MSGKRPQSKVQMNVVMEDVEQRALASSLIQPLFQFGNGTLMMSFLRYP